MLLGIQIQEENSQDQGRNFALKDPQESVLQREGIRIDRGTGGANEGLLPDLPNQNTVSLLSRIDAKGGDTIPPHLARYLVTGRGSDLAQNKRRKLPLIVKG